MPDASKFDKVFILPLFCKPGRHTYLIKYKDSKEYRQSYYKKKITKYEKRFYIEKKGEKADKKFEMHKYREAKDKLKAELFLYKLDVPARGEEIPQFVKTMKTTQKQRAYEHGKSIFSKWRHDTASSLSFAYKEDIKLWKGFRFIKDEDDRVMTEKVL